VHAGDVIATIDDGDYRLAVDSAREKVATQEATVTRMAHQITAQEAAVEQTRTQLASAQAAARRMELELNRQNALAAHDWSSRQLQEQAQANRD
jgi:membrane fusion protein, multidrug efflux system